MDEVRSPEISPRSSTPVSLKAFGRNSPRLVGLLGLCLSNCPLLMLELLL